MDPVAVLAAVDAVPVAGLVQDVARGDEVAGLGVRVVGEELAARAILAQLATLRAVRGRSGAHAGTQAATWDKSDCTLWL